MDHIRYEPIRVYADTSVFGGAFDAAFADPSLRVLDGVRSGRLLLVTSALVRDEIEQAPPAVRDLYLEVAEGSDVAELTAEALALRDAYLGADIVSAKWALDALHVATATVAGCSVLVSWNFRHIVHFQKIRLYNEVSRAQGYGDLAICSPMEVTLDDDDPDT